MVSVRVANVFPKINLYFGDFLKTNNEHFGMKK